MKISIYQIYAAKGHGVITCMAAGNDVIVLGTTKGWIIRHDFGVGDSYVRKDSDTMRFDIQFAVAAMPPQTPRNLKGQDPGSSLSVDEAQKPQSGDEAFKHFIQSHLA
ncbi:Vacuolar sorting protein 18 [Camellia lanceoleosa]|uniref:Vacuolar sorting protein 18 n=1 Tax=Camellia lanceoleosa TaxID=1840588 RepID=A0ACC0GR68_9ERIC|nr:Vacuolar sorting protein 18 [Camellia lanceoleosa]